MKKIIILFGIVLSVLLSVTAFAENDIKIGDYVQLGVYRDEPLIWRYAGDDENGKLMFNKGIICYKSFDAAGEHDFAPENEPIFFGLNLWSKSNIRDWLNSDDKIVTYTCGNPPKQGKVWLDFNVYDKERGFLTNFTDSEKNAIKSVELKTTINDSFKMFADGTRKALQLGWYLEETVEDAYFQTTTEKMFLPDYEQIKLVKNNLKDDFYYKGVTSTAAQGSYSNSGTSMTLHYILREPTLQHDETIKRSGDSSLSHIAFITIKDGHVPKGSTGAYMSSGIRPAFYLNDNVSFISGSGAIDDPYVISPTDAQEKHILSVWKKANILARPIVDVIYIRANGILIDFDDDAQPFIDSSNRTLVPVRAVSEMLDAKVDWDSENQTVTIEQNGKIIKIIIGSDTMTVDGKAVQMDTQAVISEERTYIPIRFAAEALGLTVQWVE